MDYTTVLGALAGIALLLMAMFRGSTDGAALFVNVPSIFIVVGGTLAATAIAFPSRELMTITRVMGRAFSNPKAEVNAIIRYITRCQEEVRANGHLALEDLSRRAPWHPLRTGLQLIADGTDNDTLTEILTIEQKTLEEYHRVGQRIFSEMAKYAPAFGMLGTLIGLVKMLATLDDPSGIGPKMAIALLTTFYGVLLANLVFLPMVTKLERRSRIDTLQIRLMIVGLASINKDDSMMITREKMGAFLAQKASGTALDRRKHNRGVPSGKDRRRGRR